MFKRTMVTTLAASAAFVSPAFSQAPAEFFAGKTVTVYVGLSAGGGYDQNARLVARHIGKHLPGSPTFVVRNMPGGGGLVMMNYVAGVAPRDGLHIAAPQRGVPFEPLLGSASHAKFDTLKMHGLGSVNSDTSVAIIAARTGVKKWQDLRQKEVIVAGTGVGTESVTVPYIVRNTLGLKFRVIAGYPGGSEASLAMERGEVEGRCGWSRSSLMTTKPTWASEGKISLLLQAGLQKSPLMPDVPLALDNVREEADRQLLKLAVAWDEMAWPFAAPPGVPADRAQALRAAFASVLKDPELVVQAGREGLDLNLVPPHQIERILEEVYATPEPIIAKMKDIVKAK